ncbi:MAG: Glutamyl-Q tRNA(Asp) synthetase [Candidatus Accumulibacter regalis]|jgi:glutamyl-Q tRNA(Asp) synthetase|uniref:Glutamyl-Q tRNA(Asp) synthetase n=1 Tax=Accumulibacter regalis TaxID=522306 RepID=A0A011PVA9_ACCRE|nr:MULTISPECIES: tRNA glutamyl-Q(34) synthetase GluQRS [unclassified Candidatus Accumulibacter]EXI91326.1 MAG: Glutamyl-Q tRNA(Asp) synthetase [Candidatus Accumulibacter regalis]MQM33241.1 tRNA glutamyl-Q(34) synthetase GluQRS [Candidatus Accumulibacter phosphatis]MBL8369418.1 tRNA glutamyl-Q(34) synthetase GluQRS [Accumulibacter sp.]MBN8515261.1 tRNA glutamyl-Q(34) synthetase GluQRS [Accumulibacter sp.]MBO3701324.1 tRNA glutamyl-Q(34) synthetase GluQRS [Accumulibacter sp.]
MSPARVAEASARRLPAPYRGRFAPSPTGPLHFGSLVAAVGSYLDARANGGQWLLRIEDVDQPRTLPGAADEILRTLEGFGFAWDGEVLVQSQRLDLYHAELVRLQLDGEVYPCACSRTEIAACSPPRAVDGGLVYPGTCRNGLRGGRAARAWRLRVPDTTIAFGDRVQGRVEQNLDRAVGDFILLRADGQYAYQLAVVVDDAAQGINAVVRGVDLLDSTPRQIWLQQRLALATPTYAHLPVVTNACGEKLAKQTQAPAVDRSAGSAALAAALRFLGHTVPQEISSGPLRDFWPWAIAAWSIERVPARRGIFPG